MQSGLGVEYENSESEHGDTDEEAVDEEEHDEETEQEYETVDDEETVDDKETEGDEEMDDEAVDYVEDEEEDDDTFVLLYLIADIGAMYEHCIQLKKAYRKCLKNLNDLNESDSKKVIKSYARLEIKEDQFGIENEENDECGKKIIGILSLN